ncbi:hypothetical protein BDR26DRAFT_857154, partial [Obelidium mucronatum]
SGRRTLDDGVRGLTGDLRVDGLSRFEVDLAETAAWTKRLLADMAAPAPATAARIGAQSEAAEAPALLLLQEDRAFAYDLAPAFARNGAVAAARLHLAQAAVEAALAADKPALHKFKVLAAPFFKPEQRAWVFTPASASASPTANKLELLKTVHSLLKEAANSPEALAATPVDLRHIKKPKRDLSFPEAWKQPQSISSSQSVSSSSTASQTPPIAAAADSLPI